VRSNIAILTFHPPSNSNNGHALAHLRLVIQIQDTLTLLPMLACGELHPGRAHRPAIHRSSGFNVGFGAFLVSVLQ
jgi:hypothetical protein